MGLNPDAGTLIPWCIPKSRTAFDLADGVKGVRVKYRYRSSVLVGPWRESRDQAVDDAILAGQAQRTEDGTLYWHGSAHLEDEAGGPGMDSSLPESKL